MHEPFTAGKGKKMGAIEKFLGGAVVLIGLFLVLNGQQTSKVIQDITALTTGTFKTLQGR